MNRLEVRKNRAGSGPRIELDQEAPRAGDWVTFSVTQAGADPMVKLQCGDRVAFGEDISYETMQAADKEFLLPPTSTTAIAWLLKKGEPVVGTLLLGCTVTDRVIIYKDKANEWRWRRESENGRIVSDSSEGYANLADCRETARAVNGGEYVEVDD